MRLQINQPIQGNDLAALLQGDQGTFLCQNRGHSYVTIAKEGHSIAFGPTPIGRPVVEAAPSVGNEPWTVTKISNTADLEEFQGSQFGQFGQTQRAAQQNRS